MYNFSICLISYFVFRIRIISHFLYRCKTMIDRIDEQESGECIRKDLGSNGATLFPTRNKRLVVNLVSESSELLNEVARGEKLAFDSRAQKYTRGKVNGKKFLPRMRAPLILVFSCHFFHERSIQKQKRFPFSSPSPPLLYFPPFSFLSLLFNFYFTICPAGHSLHFSSFLPFNRDLLNERGYDESDRYFDIFDILVSPHFAFKSGNLSRR